MDKYDAESFEREFRAGLAVYWKLLDRHVYPPFTNPERTAMEEAGQLWQEWMARPYDDGEEADAAVYAERANAHAQDRYAELFAMQTILMNLFAAGLFHLFEQQMASMLAHDGEDITKPLPNFQAWATTTMQVDLTQFPHWGAIQELSLVANVAKHAEGRSEQALRQIRPEYFGHPLLREPAYQGMPAATMPTRQPLAGTDLYITKPDFEGYATALDGFWDWFLTQVKALP